MKYLARVQQGFTMIAALFLLVVLAALGAFMVTISNTQQLTAAQDVNGSRAYWAARAGLEWAIPQVIDNNGCPLLPATFVVDTFTVQTTCQTTSYNDGATVTIINITSLACNTTLCGAGVGGIAYVERSISASMEI